MELLKALSDAPGISGNEAAVRKIIREAIQEHVDELRVDNLGNLIARKQPANQPADLRVMVAAHMDEVGFMVVKIDSDGLLKFRTIGGIDRRIVLSKAVRIGDDGVPGIIGVKPIHLMDHAETRKVLDIESLAIDIGATSADDAKKSVKLGDYVHFDTRFSQAGDLVKGKAFDDRVGCAMLAALLKEDYPFEFIAAFTVQEELRLRGARVVAYDVDPDVAFVLEGTIADDLPKDKDTSPTTEVGKGPAITFMDRSVIPDKRLVRLLVETAETHGIPYQLRRALGGGTDAGQIHLAREGIPSAVVSVPCRYIHSPAALLSPEDFKHTIELMTHALNRLPAVWANVKEKQSR
ncbi:MAG: M42 family metallopeptidase [Anaerolineae bacterium]